MSGIQWKKSYFSTKTCVVGTQKNRLKETTLLNTQNMLKLIGKNIFTILRSKFVYLNLWLNLHGQLSSGVKDIILLWSFIYAPTLCVRAMKVLATPRVCAGSSEPSRLAYVARKIQKPMSWLILFYGRICIFTLFIPNITFCCSGTCYQDKQCRPHTPLQKHVTPG